MNKKLHTYAACAVIFLFVGFCAKSQAKDKWSFEFEFGVKVNSQVLFDDNCDKDGPVKVPKHFPEYNKTWDFPHNCGGRNPFYSHWLGRDCLNKQLGRIKWWPKRLHTDCGWRHFSHAFESKEIWGDIVVIRNKLTW